MSCELYKMRICMNFNWKYLKYELFWILRLFVYSIDYSKVILSSNDLALDSTVHVHIVISRNNGYIMQILESSS
jgi:hypothetical protein